MNASINKYLLAGDKFMPKMDMRLPRSIYSACGPFTKTDKEYKNSIPIGETYKAWFQHDMVYGEFEDIPRDTIVRNKVQ